MQASHVISSRNRAAQLGVTLRKLECEAMRRRSVELVLVDSASNDNTFEVMTAFAAQAPMATRVARADRPGAGIGRNLGIATATHDLLIFSDDDCYPEPGYYDRILDQFDFSQYQYGQGEILLFDLSDDSRIATTKFAQEMRIPPQSIIRAGGFQSANMFAHRKVFEKAGLFAEDLGPGTGFICEDVEFATRASFAGFTGVILPSWSVRHHHGRKPGSRESEDALRSYDVGRGAYYAILMTRGINEIWELWQQTSLAQAPMPLWLKVRLEREFRGAADYLKHQLDCS